jgi:hypothetical protein
MFSFQTKNEVAICYPGFLGERSLYPGALSRQPALSSVDAHTLEHHTAWNGRVIRRRVEAFGKISDKKKVVGLKKEEKTLPIGRRIARADTTAPLANQLRAWVRLGSFGRPLQRFIELKLASNGKAINLLLGVARSKTRWMEMK